MQELLKHFTRKELSEMTALEAMEELESIQEGIMQDKQDAMIYGDPDHERYLLSDSYEADCKSEKWDWLKNA